MDMSTANTDPPPSSGKTSFLKTCINGINALSGVGLLSIPYALSQGGWLSLIVFMAIAVICFYTGLLLQRCMDSSSLVNTYPDIGAHAFGRRGRVIVATFMYLELYLVAIDFLILEGDNLHKLFPAASFRLRALRVRGKQGCPDILHLLHAAQVLLLCFIVSTLSYGLMGIVGYLMYGDTLKSQITLNVPSASVAAKVAIYTTLVNPLAKYALVVAPVAEAAEGALGVGKSAPFRALVRTVLVVGTAVVALAVPFFADVVGLTGALLSCTATMLLPCLCYLKVRSKIGGGGGYGAGDCSLPGHCRDWHRDCWAGNLQFREADYTQVMINTSKNADCTAMKTYGRDFYYNISPLNLACAFSSFSSMLQPHPASLMS
ncbi:hypothetical protein TRIUR3_07065 [Triticum urartu]|uniref:Amino acid transporter transmembrane domain-containing protein n=1 Tax=Triticum urartu TaxID=4572 RepID=M7Z3B6_TRIUA|nr:hypothetical protein TRIUR3_07065 [Triticum urartu]